MKYYLVTGIVLILLCVVNIFAEASNMSFPSFIFEAYDGTVIEKDSLHNSGIKLVIYGTPDALTSNRTQLDQILEHLKLTKQTDKLLYTINFSAYPRLLRGIIKAQMEDNAGELGITIYADWKGILCEYFELDRSQVIFFLIDTIGNIQERFYFKNSENGLKRLNMMAW